MTTPSRNLKPRIPCPDCGKLVTANSLRRHRDGNGCMGVNVPERVAVLACSECGWSVRVASDNPGKSMYRHARRCHGRGPLPVELTPSRPQEAAA